MSLRSTTALVFICSAALASLNAQEAPSGRSEAGEFQKMAPALKFLRTRNARDYAVTTPNGIDEATYVKIGGLEQWITIRGEDRKNPVLLILHGAWRCHESAGLRRVSLVAEELYRRACGMDV